MLGRHRELILLFSLAAILSASLWLGMPPSRPDLPGLDKVEKQVREKQSKSFQPGGADCRSDGDADRCAEKAEQHRLEVNDLVQQTREANAAEAQAHIGHNMSWMVLIGTAGGFFTLAAALAAALAARQAAEAAKHSLEHAQNATTDELRPWLQLEIVPVSFQLDEKEASARFFLRLKNLGRLPATGVYWDAKIYDFESGMKAIPTNFAGDFHPRNDWIPRTILPQGQIEIPLKCPMGREDLSVSKSHGQALIHPVLAVRVEYGWSGGGPGSTWQSFEILRQRRSGAEHHNRIAINADRDTERKFEVKQIEFDRIC